MLKVVCALIKNNSGRWLMVQRSERMKHPGLWEFPGGKLEGGESPFEAIEREIREELRLKIKAVKQQPSVVWEYDGKNICLIPIICEIRSGKIYLTEHSKYRWVSMDTMDRGEVLEADIQIINLLRAGNED